MRVSAPVKDYIKNAIEKKVTPQLESLKSQVKEREDRNNRARYFIIEHYKKLLGKVMQGYVDELASAVPEGTTLNTCEWNEDKKAMPIPDRLISDAARVADFRLDDPTLVEQQNKIRHIERIKANMRDQIIAELELGRLKLADLDARLEKVNLLEEKAA